MAHVRREILVDAPPEAVWDALRDWGALHERLVPGFVVDAKLDGEDRIVTFFNGVVVRELLVDLDEGDRRLVWSVREGPYTHHNGVAQVIEDGAGATRFVWTADFLPHELEERTAGAMELGLTTLKEKLEAGA
jgi:carbon monoxide dehydrogenase subunit G